MALGILSVSAGLGGEQVLSALLLGLAVVTLAAMAPGVLRAGSSRLETAFVWLTLAAGCGVLADRIGSFLWPATYLFAVFAVAGWMAGELLLARVLVSWPGGWRRLEVTGSWLLAVVAVQSMSILASAAGGRAWALIAAGLWVLGVLVYAALIALIVRRLVHREIRVESHTPDYWISMGGLAITAVAAFDLAGTLVGDARVLFMWLGGAALVTAVLWIPYLVAMEALLVRAGAFRRAYDSLRWSTVFPLGMLSVAIYGLAHTTDASSLLIFAQASFWAGIAVALLNIAMLVFRNV
jgi:tellurite resistance protein TehA-like permease